MKIRVYAPPFGNHDVLDEKGLLSLPAGASLSDLFGEMKIPRIWGSILMVSVNYQRVKGKTPLKDGDIVTFFWPLSGG